MFQLEEQHKMVQDMVRSWCEKVLLPRVPALEKGDELPYDLMRQMAQTFGLGAMASSGVKKKIKKLREGEAAGGDAAGDMMEAAGNDPMMMYVVIKELSRVSPGFAMSWGVSMGLAAGAILAKGTADQ